MACIEEIANDAKVIDDQLLVLIKRQVETELMLEEKFRDLCEEVSNFVKEIEDVVKEVERLSCKNVAKETVRLFRRGQKRGLYKMTRLQMMVNESHLSVREKHKFVSKMNLERLRFGWYLISGGLLVYSLFDSQSDILFETTQTDQMEGRIIKYPPLVPNPD
ncbi:hypothetical protein Tco_1062759 [Tanacetum coccineum]